MYLSQKLKNLKQRLSKTKLHRPLPKTSCFYCSIPTQFTIRLELKLIAFNTRIVLATKQIFSA